MALAPGPAGLKFWRPASFEKRTPNAWNIEDRSSGIRLSADAKTATRVTGVTQGVRSTTTKLNGTTGKYYVEFAVTVASFEEYGLLPTASPIQGIAGAMLVAADGWIWLNSVRTAVNIGAITTDVVCLAWDAGSEQFWFRKNNDSWNASGTADPATGTGGIDASVLNAEDYALFTHLGTVAVTTLRTELADFTYQGPSGFTSWMGEPLAVASTVETVGTADGVGAASAVGEAINVAAADGTADGIGAASATGSSITILEGVGDADGVGAASATGVALAIAAGTAAGVGAASATGTGIAVSAGTAAGIGAASAEGAIVGVTSSAQGTAAGIGAATATGTGIKAANASAASGLGTASATGQSFAASAGDADGLGTASATGAVTGASVGSATGVGSATATGGGIGSGVGDADGIGAATATGRATGASAGDADGIGTAAATATATTASAGTATGTGAALALSDPGTTTGEATGQGTAAATGRAIAVRVGAASGVGSAAATGALIVAGAGTAAGIGTAAAVSEEEAGVIAEAVGTASGVGEAIGWALEEQLPIAGGGGGGLRFRPRPAVIEGVGYAVLPELVGFAIGEVGYRPKLIAGRAKGVVALTGHCVCDVGVKGAAYSIARLPMMASASMDAGSAGQAQVSLSICKGAAMGDHDPDEHLIIALMMAA